MSKIYFVRSVFIFLFTISNLSLIATNVLEASGLASSSVPVTNLQAVLTNPLTGQVKLTWECTPGSGFQYYQIDRNGLAINTVLSDTNYSDILPAPGNYEYCVIAVYSGDTTSPACTTLIWSAPSAQISVDSLYETVWTNCEIISDFYLRNTGEGILAFEFPEYMDHSTGFSPVYCAASAGVQDETIGRVQCASIDHSSGWAGYNDFSSYSTTLMKSQSCPINITGGGNAYPGDLVGVWIDYDHNSVFDNAEFTLLTTLGGGSSFTGNISPPLTALSGPTTMRIRLQYLGTLDPCGTTTYGEVEDYTVVLNDPSFITWVSPVSGIVMPGDSVAVSVNFSATGLIYSQIGTYHDELIMNTNDAANLAMNIPATMSVGWGCHVQGTVGSFSWGQPEPLAGVKVQGGSHTAYTNSQGIYDLHLSQGTYTLHYSRTGYQPLDIPGISLSDSTFITIDTTLVSIAYPPACATAAVNFEDTQCTVTWCPPSGQQELIYDDSVGESSSSWPESGFFAVKFTPENYPVTITGAKFYLTSNFMGNPIGSSLKAQVYLPDGNGLPGLLVDSASTIINNFGWVQVEGLNTTINYGDFFIALYQYLPWPDCPELFVDATPPASGRSYFKNLGGGGDWTPDASQNYMIHALVNGPGEFNQYALYRASNFDPNEPPTTGAYTLLNTSLVDTVFYDWGMAWIALPPGWYAYGIRTVNYGMQSDIVFSNCVPHKLYEDLLVTAHLSCGNAPASGAIVKLTGLIYPYDVLTDTLPSTGSDSLLNIIEGDYICTITYPGYEQYYDTLSLYSNLGIEITLQQAMWPPRNHYVDDQSLMATWDEPLAILIDEDFEGPIYPPEGWQSSSLGAPGWFYTSAGSSMNWMIPPHTSYAVSNDDMSTSSNGCCDYLITPELDLTAAPSYMLSFQSYFTGDNGQTATVEMSTDNGVTWSPIYSCAPFSNWYQVEIDLSTYSGPTGLSAVRFAFHSNDSGNQGSGWAIDDVRLVSGGIAVEGFNVYLDSVLVNTAPVTDLSYPFDPMLFAYGETHTSCVTTVFCSGESENDCFTFTSHYLPAPGDLLVTDSVTPTEGFARISWGQLLDAGLPVISYKIFRNWDSLTQVPASDTTFLDQGLSPGDYLYQVSAVYDLSTYGFPGQIDESLRCGPDSILIIYGPVLPFNEDFSSGQFNPGLWQNGENWVIDVLSDDTDPAAKFMWNPLLENYSSALQSTWLDATGFDSLAPYYIWLDFDLKLDDVLANGTEAISIEVMDSTGWHIVSSIPNNGSFDWVHQHMDISAFSMDQFFKIGFFANGVSSQAIHYWAVDNIQVYSETALVPPLDLVADLQTPQGNSVVLTWNAPQAGKKSVPAETGWMNVGPVFAGEIMNTGETRASGAYAVTLLGYNIYRKEIGSATDTGFVMIAFTDSLAYLDENIPNFPVNCYAYKVTALYDFGESAASNADSVCLYTSIRTEMSSVLKIYPNPASLFARIEMNGQITGGSVFDAYGNLITSWECFPGSGTYWLDTSAFLPGFYTLRVITPNGIFSGRIVVIK